MKNVMKQIVFGLLAIVCALGAQAQENRPAILIDNWGAVPDLQYMKQLQAAGFEVECINHNQLTWDRLKQYNALVLLDFPQEGQVTQAAEGGPASGPNLEQTLALVDQFLAEGGGVMVNLVQHANGAGFYNTTQKALARWARGGHSSAWCCRPTRSSGIRAWGCHSSIPPTWRRVRSPKASRASGTRSAAIPG